MDRFLQTGELLHMSIGLLWKLGSFCRSLRDTRRRWSVVCSTFDFYFWGQIRNFNNRCR